MQGLTPARTAKLVIANGPAVDLTKLRGDGKVDLAKKADKAGIALSRAGLHGIRAQAVMLLDHSASMRSDYAGGHVARLVSRALGFALQIDMDGKIPIIAFDTVVHDPVVVTVDNHETAVDRIWRRGAMGSTNLGAAIRAAIQEAAGNDVPTYCLVVTDGSPYLPDRPKARAVVEATQAVIESARWPVFIKFLALRNVPYLQDLDDLPPTDRLLDNVNAATIHDGLTDMEFAELMAEEWDSWVRAALGAGVLVN